jgi:signal transduction histidine kinase
MNPAALLHRGRFQRLVADLGFAMIASIVAFALAAIVTTIAEPEVPVFVVAALYISVVLAVAHVAGFAYAVPIAMASLLAIDWFYVPPTHSLSLPSLTNDLAAGTYLAAAVVVGRVAERAGRRAAVSEAKLAALADEQAALRRVATVVAHERSMSETFSVVTAEVRTLLRLDAAVLLRYDVDGGATVMAISDGANIGVVPGSRVLLESGGGMLAVVFGDARLRATHGAPLIVAGQLWGVLLAAWRVGSDQPPPGVENRLGEFTELAATAVANTEARADLARLAEEQAALRRVATLVGQGAAPGTVFSAVAKEIAGVMHAESAKIIRYDGEETATIVAGHGGRGWPVGTKWGIEDTRIARDVFTTGKAVRVDDVHTLPDIVAAQWLENGSRTGVGAPIVVDGRLWGAAAAFSFDVAGLPADTESRIAQFTELIAIAISNAATRAELAASRLRVVSAADETRRRLERDLHDGIQQRLVSIALKLRCAEIIAATESAELRAELLQVEAAISGAIDELRELSRGLHPALLSESGLEPALKALARRSVVPVRLAVLVEEPLPDPVEVAAYYVASEALTNAAKHAEASRVDVRMARRDGNLDIEIRDDGVGGADPALGSGLIGLSDRVTALGGSLSVTSPAGAGTSLHVLLPIGSPGSGSSRGAGAAARGGAGRRPPA